MSLTAPTPTRAAGRPLAPALPADPAPAGPAAPARAARPFHGRTRVVPFVVGAVLALALADTRAAPVVVAVLVGAVIFQVMQL